MNKEFNHITISADQVLLIKRTWKIFRSIDPLIVGDTFYSKLFAENSSLRRMFPKNMDEQYRKLIDMLNIMVGKLDSMNELGADITTMAIRHAGYGVRPAHYKFAGKALLWTLQQGLGKDWTPAIGKAWTDCYTLIAGMMIDAASPVTKVK